MLSKVVVLLELVLLELVRCGIGPWAGAAGMWEATTPVGCVGCVDCGCVGCVGCDRVGCVGCDRVGCVGCDRVGCVG
ncbi:hypothetical protein ACWD25_60200, partial [Streptomyces sp. NPDC002920]